MGNWSDTVQGESDAVTVHRGIRQGCPMSPMLFAIYVYWVTECLQASGKQGKPSMLMYADDIQVWADTREGLEEKMRVVWQALSDLGMEISWKKTAVQANQ